MANKPRRQRATISAGARVRQKPAELHEGTPEDFLRRHERETARAVHANKRIRDELQAHLFTRTADPRNLHVAWKHIQEGGQAPGVDGLRPGDLDHYEAWDMVRTASKAILDDTYRRAPTRRKQIPKAKGTRTLGIPTTIDRMVERAIVQIIQPILDPLFDDRSLGYRPGCNRYQALAVVESIAKRDRRWIWIADDLKDAFDNVPQKRLLDVIRLHIHNEDLLRLIGRVVSTKTGKGVQQGGNLSPLLLNLYLDHFLDRQWRRLHPDTPLVRVADDLLILCATQEEALLCYADLKRLIRDAGMPSKGNPATSVQNLTMGKAVDWLGFNIHKDGEDVVVTLSEKTWKRLGNKLALAHGKPDAPLRAVETICGWIAQQGPAYPQANGQETYAKIVHLAMEQAFEEIPSKDKMESLWRKSHSKWIQCRQRYGAIACGTGGSARQENRADSGLPREASGRPASRDLSLSLREYKMYTDGACFPDSEVGGWAYIIEEIRGAREAHRAGSSPRTTNNRMELMAVLRGLESIGEPARILIVTDSEYVSKGINEWLPVWREQQWRRGSGRRKKPIENLELWQRLDGFLQRHQVTCEWVRSHCGHPENEECDRLARQAAEELNRELTRGGIAQCSDV
jgi:group II intron reverse transcriptase/maturase